LFASIASTFPTPVPPFAPLRIALREGSIPRTRMLAEAYELDN